ncbi:uncharacterized protein LOC141903364 [Tubulanus polymorphus]|uniref:uncharacterized protein LOC141903364 n=1 Tax=Tubulanus polymorphus TaxID=672921 RepID=UPI003DA31372
MMAKSDGNKTLSCHFPDEFGIRIENLPSESKTALNVLSICKSKFLTVPKSDFSWHETSVIGLDNQQLIDDFKVKLWEMHTQGCSEESLDIDYAFRCIGIEEIESIARSGLAAKTSSNNHHHSLGDKKFGIVLMQNFDTCLHMAQMYKQEPPIYVLICKIWGFFLTFPTAAEQLVICDQKQLRISLRPQP